MTQLTNQYCICEFCQSEIRTQTNRILNNKRLSISVAHNLNILVESEKFWSCYVVIIIQIETRSLNYSSNNGSMIDRS